jgi:hypothetical protein
MVLYPMLVHVIAGLVVALAVATSSAVTGLTMREESEVAAGALHGTMLTTGPRAPIVLIVPGSGPPTGTETAWWAFELRLTGSSPRPSHGSASPAFGSTSAGCSAALALATPTR